MDERLQQVLDFWFGDNWHDAAVTAKTQGKIWWQKSAETDSDIRHRFAELLYEEMQDKLQDQRAPEALLARIILTDQMTRNMFRGQPQSFACDERARWLSCQLLERDDYLPLPLIAQVFVFMPLEHSERLADQQMCLQYFQALVERAEPDQKGLFRNYLDYAQKHLEIIERFGRFPHRNAIVGRDSTREEQDFLRQPGSSF